MIHALVLLIIHDFILCILSNKKPTGEPAGAMIYALLSESALEFCDNKSNAGNNSDKDNADKNDKEDSRTL